MQRTSNLDTKLCEGILASEQAAASKPKASYYAATGGNFTAGSTGGGHYAGYGKRGLTGEIHTLERNRRDDLNNCSLGRLLALKEALATTGK